MSRQTYAAICLLALTLGGCGANNNSIFRTTASDSNEIILVDAKQRAILTQTIRDDSYRQRILACSEASPDVFSVISAALTGNAAIDLSSGDSAAAEFASSISESGASIGLRTQTIQVLRDMMFRLCERYFNGAMSAEEFRQQAARDQRLIAAILAIEQLTGAVAPAPVTIFAAAKVDSGESLVTAQKLLDAARAELATLEADATTRESAATQAEAAYRTKEEESKKEGSTVKPEELASLKSTAEQARAAATDAREKADEATANVAALEAHRDAARTAAAVGTAGGELGQTTYETTIDEQTASTISDAVVKIVALVFDDDEVVRQCISDIKGEPSEFCKRYLLEKLKQDQETRNQVLASVGGISLTELVEVGAEMAIERKSAIDKVVAAVDDGAGTVHADKWKALLEEAGLLGNTSLVALSGKPMTELRAALSRNSSLANRLSATLGGGADD